MFSHAETFTRNANLSRNLSGSLLRLLQFHDDFLFDFPRKTEEVCCVSDRESNRGVLLNIYQDEGSIFFWRVVSFVGSIANICCSVSSMFP